jgi:hypothetical protein
MKERASVEGDMAAASETQGNMAAFLDAKQATSEAFAERFAAVREMGIVDFSYDEQDQKLRDSGRGDLADNVDKAIQSQFEAEKKAGVFNLGEDEALAKAKAELAAAIERQAASAAALAAIDEKLAATPEKDRESLIRERQSLQAKMEDDARASQAKVDAARDASTREAEQAKSGERGRELARDPDERFKAESEQGLADIQTYFERRAEANGGLRPAGDAEAQAAAEERFRKEREKEARTATSAGRGAELGMTDLERFARDFKEGAGKDIRARAGQLQAETGERPTGFINEALKQQMEQVAPMLASFRDERANADFQGPSRKALQMSDVTTGAGQTELNRLLRGDDASKDVNLVELQKQTDKLQILIDTVKGSPLPVVN